MPSLNAIVDVLGRLGVEVRQASLGGTGGGLCKVYGKPVLFIDLDTDGVTRVERSLTALATLPDVDSVYMTPQLREQIERIRTSMPHKSTDMRA